MDVGQTFDFLLSSQEELPHHAAMSEVAIHISNHTIHKRDRGLVVVGASSRLGELGDGFGASRPPDSVKSDSEIPLPLVTGAACAFPLSSERSTVLRSSRWLSTARTSL